MRNKLLIGAASAALMLAVAVPAFASWETNIAVVGNSSSAYANTGNGVQQNSALADQAFVSGSVGTVGSNTSYTGNAKAKSTAVVVANTRVGCAACGGGFDITTDSALVGNEGAATADSGNGLQINDSTAHQAFVSGGVGTNGSNYSSTGSAKAKSNAWVVVNTRISPIL